MSVFIILMLLTIFFSFFLSPSFFSYAFFSLFLISLIYHPSLISVWQPISSSRRWTRRRAGHLPVPLLLLSSHLPPCPMPTKWRWFRLLPARSQSGGYAKWQPIITDWAILSPPARTRHFCPTLSAKCKLQLWKSEHWAANPCGIASRSTTTPAPFNKPCDVELEGQRSGSGA